MSSDKSTDCRACKGTLSTQLVLDNMPAKAQHFPGQGELASDKGETLTVCQCDSCGLVQLSCEPVEYYREVIRAAAFSDEMGQFRTQQFKTFVETHQLAGKKVLEVGAGQGEYMQLMQAQGAETWGTEYSCQKKPNPRIIQTYLEHPAQTLEQAPFDGFYCLNFLEHMPDVCSSLKAIAGNLKPNAIGLIEVPNFDMIIKEQLFSEFIKDHLFYFTEKTLTNLLESNGFDVINCKPTWHDYSLSAVIQKRGPTDLQPLNNFQKKVATDIDRFAARFTSDEIAIWGAGHQALAVISLLELDKKVTLIVDSATFKQNKFTPASHIPIHPPERLNNGDIKAVIVMAASYSDEVAGILQREYPSHLEVAILRSHGLELM